MGRSPCSCLALALVALILALGGCGGDEGDESTAPVVTAPTEAEPLPEETETAPTETLPPPGETVPAEEGPTETAPSPEEAPGGAGDEEPARTLALFTASGGRIAPRVIRVPAFISIEIQLHSADGQRYGLRFNDVTITAGGEGASPSVTIDGLRPNMGIVGVPTGAGNRVRVEATAEPGP